MTLDRDEQRRGVPARVEPGERYGDVDISKRIVGETHDRDATGDA